MPRPMGKGVPEKSKDFKGSLLRLFKNLRKWRTLMVVSIILALISSILSIIAPDILSNLTDEITGSLKPNTENITLISKNIASSFTSEESYSIPALVINSNDISSEDKEKAVEIYNSISSDNGNASSLFMQLPDSVLILYLNDFTVDDVVISKNDQLEFIKVMSGVDYTNMDKTELMSLMDKLPNSISTVIKGKMNVDKIKKISIILGSLYITSALFSFIQQFSMTTISNNFARRLRSDITIKINKLPLKFFDHHENGNVLSIMTNDVDTIAQNMNQSLATLVSNVTLFAGSIVMMFITEWRLALTAILASILGFVFMGFLLGKSQKYFNRRQKELGEMNGYIEEMYSGHNVVKAYNGTKNSIKEFNVLNEKLFDSNRLSAFISGIMQPIMGFIGNLGYVAVCVVGAILVSKNVITFGVIVAFMIYVRLFTNPLSQIAQAMSGLQSSVAASERVFEFLDEKEMSDESTLGKNVDVTKLKGNIEFKNVKFGYDDDRLIIKGFNAKVNDGDKIAIVGPTGAGKTTMVNLLMKFYEINDGEILIDGHKVSDLTREQIHNLFIMVLQDTWLFEGTIRDNIKFNKLDVTDEEIWNALKVVGIDHFVKTLPGGLDAVISDNDTISQGQKQLLTIARGMIENEPFLILDEATSNVDTRTEELVQKAMDKLTKGRTSFIIAHRLSTIKNANLILVMNEGNIVEMGTHEELMKKNGFYADLYNSQFKK